MRNSSSIWFWRWFGLTALVCSSAWAQPDSPRVQRRVQPGTVQLGEPFLYELVLTHPLEHRYELLAPSDTGDFEVLESTRSRLDGSQDATTTFRLKVALFALGTHTLPTLTFEVTHPGGVAEYPLPGAQVEGVSSLPPHAAAEGADLLDIQPPQEVPVRTWRLLYALAGMLAAALLGYALFRYLQRPRPVRAEQVRALPLHQRTLQALETLRAENLPAQGRAQEFHFRLSEIARTYLGERYGFEALESTSRELLEELAQRDTPGLPADELRQFALHSDLVKYAKAQATPEACRLALEFVARLVHQTAVLPATSVGPAQPSAGR